jgi:hypothetical protein
MMTAVVRRVLVGLALFGVVPLAANPPAFAGGGMWKFDREGYEPGEVATAVVGVAWEHDPELGTPAEGPYFAYLFPVDSVLTKPWPNPPDGALLVGEVEVGPGPVEEAPGFRVGPNHARLRFTVPSLPAGRYEVRVCNRPCTKSLGDITWGVVAVGATASGPGAAATTASASPRAAATVRESRGIAESTWLLVIGASLATCLVAGWSLRNWRRHSRVRPSA